MRLLLATDRPIRTQAPFCCVASHCQALPNAAPGQCGHAYISLGVFATSRFKVLYALVSIVSIVDQLASVMESTLASRNAIASARSIPASRNFSLFWP